MKKYETKDSGKRQNYNSGMRRDIQEGKPRYDLLIPLGTKDHMLKRWAMLMERGMAKYSQPIPVTNNYLFNHLCDTIGICRKQRDYNANILIELYTAITCAGLVTKNSYEKSILHLQKDNSQTELLGEEEMWTESEKQTKDELATHAVLKGTGERELFTDTKLEGLLKKKTPFYLKSKNINAEYANETLGNSPCILTMTASLGLQEVTCVVGATTALECLVTVLEVLKRQYNTSKIVPPIPLLILGDELFLENDRNWELANSEEEMIRFKSSAFRHFIQWFEGEDDEDHASAVYFNIQAYEFVKGKLDDKS